MQQQGGGGQLSACCAQHATHTASTPPQPVSASDTRCVRTLPDAARRAVATPWCTWCHSGLYVP